jgi:cytochrome P450
MHSEVRDIDPARVMSSVPSDSFLGGNARSFGRDGLAFYERCERLGPLVRGRAYVFDFYVVTGPDLIEEILVRKHRRFHKPGLLKGLRMLFGDGLLTADGDLWRHRRRTLQPVFHPRRMEEYTEEIQENVQAELGRWTDGVRDVHKAVVALCLRNLTRTLFGVEDGALSAEIEELASLCHEVTRAAMSFRFPYYGLLAMFPPLARIPFGARIRRLEESIVERVTALRKRSPRDDFFGRLTTSKDADGCPMRGRAIRDELITMLLAGHETAAAAVSWALYLLARHPEVRGRVVAELDAVCEGALPTSGDLENLPRLGDVVVETYRLYPPTHRIGRRVAEPVTIGGVPLDVGAEVLLPQWAVHRSERWYDAPHEFRPDRWTPELQERLPPYAYFPFSGGPRVCIGESLVTHEVALVLGSIVKTFDFELVDAKPIAPTEGLTLVPGDGSLRLRLRRRPRKIAS